MTKILFILSALVMVIAGIFSFQNRETFLSTRRDRTTVVDNILKEKDKVTTLNAQVGTVREGIARVTTEVTNENERLNVANIKLKNAIADSERLTKEVDASSAKIAEYKLALKDLPKDVSLETINEDVNKLKQSIADSESQATKIGEQVTAKEGEVKKTQAKLDSVIEKIESRKKLFERNSMTATIVAVNNDWGFVIIDSGESKGITVDTKLLVTRGQETIGRLNIIDVSGSRTVANIDQKSLRPGITVAPGDRVILETLYQ